MTKSIKILIADDHPLSREVIVDLIRSWLPGVNIAVVKNGTSPYEIRHFKVKRQSTVENDFL